MKATISHNNCKQKNFGGLTIITIIGTLRKKTTIKVSAVCLTVLYVIYELSSLQILIRNTDDLMID